MVASQTVKINITALDKTRVAFSRVTGGLNRINRRIGGLAKGFVNLRNIAIVAIGAMVIGKIASIAGEFEDLRTAIKAVTGSAASAAKAFTFIETVAAKTPFSVQTMTKAFITLQASGIKPTEKLLLGFSDAASVTTDRLGTFEAQVRLLSRSIAGGLGLEELNQIADRGLPVWAIFKERLGLSRLEISKVGQTAAGAKKLLDALTAGLKERFGGATLEALSNLNTKISNLGDAFNRFLDTFASTTGLMQLFKGAIDNATINLSKMEKAFRESTILKWFRDLVGIAVPAFENTAAGANKVAAAIDKTTAKIDKNKAAVEKSVAAIRLKNLQTSQLIDAQGRGAKAVADLKNAIELENEATRLGVDFTKQYGQAWSDAYRQGQTLEGQLKAVTVAQQRSAEIGKEFGSAISQGLEGAITKAKSFKDALRGVVSEIALIAMRKSIIEPLGNSLGGGLSSLFGFAHGGSFSVGGSGGTDSQMVAFRATPGENVTVTPPGAQGRGNGPAKIFNIDARGASLAAVQELRNMVFALDGSIDERAVSAVADDRARGGLTAQPLGA